MRTDRLELRLAPEETKMAEKAAKLSGENKTQIMRRGGLQEVRRIIATAKQQ